MTTILSEIYREIIRWLKKVWFEAKLTARLQMIEWQNLRESEEERRERFEPVYQEKAVDPVLQTGESQLLGGEMRLAAKWVIEAEEKERAEEQFKKVAWAVSSDLAIKTGENAVDNYEKLLKERGIESSHGATNET